MSMQSLALRRRAQSTVSLRKHLIRTNSEQRPPEIKKSSTMTSFRPKLQRLIQEGKIQQIMNQDPSSKAHLFYTNQVNEMERELASTKKSLSTLVIKARGKDQAINQVKNDIKKVQHEIDIIASQASFASQRYSTAAEELAARKTEQQTIYWNDKMFGQLKDHRYKDEVFLKGRYEALQREHAVEQQNRKLLQQKYHELKQLNRQLHGYRNEAESIAREQAAQQNEYISLVQADMSERQMLGQLKADKHKREGQINQIASSLIEREQLQRILEVLYSHRLLSQIIRVKSNSLILKYAGVNKAYNFIRSNSNIVEPQKILKRMEEHDKLYDDALKRVSGLEGQLAALERSLENCTISKNEILSREGQLASLAHGYYQGLEHDRYQLLVSQKEKLQERHIADEVLRKNVLGWGERLFARFGITQSENNSFLDCLTDLVVRIRQQK